MRLGAVLAGGWMLCALPLAAHATDSGEETEAEASEAEASPADALIAEGVALRREGREAEALERFRQAHELSPSARALGQMGLAAKSLRRYVDAETHLEAALADEDDPWVQKNRGALELAREIVAKQLAWLGVAVNVDHADLFVNGSRVAELPLTGLLRVDAGPITVEVRADGYQAASMGATLQAGATEELALSLEPLADAPTVAPPRPAPPDAGETAPVERASWAPWIVATGAVGGAGLIVGTALGIRTLVVKGERDELCGDTTCATDRGLELDAEARDMALGSTVAFVIGGLGAAAAVTLFILEPDDGPTVAIGPSGLWLASSF